MKDFEELRLNCPAFTTGMHNAPKCGAKAYQDHHTTWLQPCYEKDLCPMIYWLNIMESEKDADNSGISKVSITILGILIMFFGFMLIISTFF